MRRAVTYLTRVPIKGDATKKGVKVLNPSPHLLRGPPLGFAL